MAYSAAARAAQCALYTETSVDDLAEILCRGVTPSCPAYGDRHGGPATAENAAARLRSAKQALSAVMGNYPRSHGESVEAYAVRIFATPGDRMAIRDRVRMAYSHVQWFDPTARAAHDEAQRDERHARLKAQAEVDGTEVERLVKVIEKAAAGERLLADIGRALFTHYEGRKARRQLAEIYDRAIRAEHQLGEIGGIGRRPDLPPQSLFADQFANAMNLYPDIE